MAKHKRHLFVICDVSSILYISFQNAFEFAVMGTSKGRKREDVINGSIGQSLGWLYIEASFEVVLEVLTVLGK